MGRIPRACLPMLRFQRGIASVGIASLILLLIAAGFASTFSITGSVVQDAAVADQRLQALFLAESGLERAASLFANSSTSATCTGLPGSATNITSGSSTIGSFTIVSATYDSTEGSCLVRVSGTPAGSQVVRTIESKILPTLTSGSIVSKGNLKFTHTVAPGTDIMVVTVAWTTSTANTDATVKFGASNPKTFNSVCGAPSVPCTPATSPVYSGSISLSKIFYLLNPPIGTDTGTVTLTPDTTTASVTIGALNFSGVDQTTPIAEYWMSPSTTPTASAFSKTITAIDGNLVLDVVQRQSGGNMTATGCSRTPLWSSNASGNAGAGSYCEATSTMTTIVMGWDFSGGSKRAYAHSVAELNAKSTDGKGGRLRQKNAGSGGGIQSWREVFTAPS